MTENQRSSKSYLPRLLGEKQSSILKEDITKLALLDYFIRKPDLRWFENPQRPAPPLYTRPHSGAEPVCRSPIGQIHADCELVLLTKEQITMWRMT